MTWEKALKKIYRFINLGMKRFVQCASMELFQRSSSPRSKWSLKMPSRMEAFGFTSTLTRRQYEIGTAHAANLPVLTAPKPAEEKPKQKSRACEETGCGNEAAWGAKRRCIAHGGDTRCEELGCFKTAVGSTARCIAHGGGARCEELDCGA